MKNRLLRFGGTALLALALAACGGDDGAPGKDGRDGVDGKDADPTVVADLQEKVKELTQAANPETCVTCHTGDDSIARTGPAHQARYAEFYQDGVVKIANMAITTNGVDATTLTFTMTKNGGAFDCRKTDAFAIGSYWSQYDGATKSFPTGALSLKPAAAGITYDGSGGCTFTKTYTSDGDKAKVATLAASSGVVQIYGVDEILEVNPDKRLSLGKYPFAGVLKLGTVDYDSAANVSGCENCHTRPFLKHAYIYGEVDGLEFYTCKGCHYDTRPGGHQDWQLLKDDEARYAALNALAAAAKEAGDTTKDSVVENMTAEEKAKYAYKAKLMNDVHMSHAMEFAFPQSMKNCVTCHAGKLDRALDNVNFKAETCKSCHAVDGLKGMMTAAIFPHTFQVADLDASVCTLCHKDTGGEARGFAAIHGGGYDAKIYTSTGQRYSSTFTVKIDSATKTGNTLTIKFSATEAPDIAGLSAEDITPTVLVGLYGYNSKDFLVAAHGTAADGKYNLEYMWDCVDLASCGGSTRTLSRNFPTTRFTQVGKTTAAGTTTWELTADLSLWADQIADGTIKRAEIAVMPELKNADGVTLGLNAPSRTFDFARNAFDDTFFKDIVKVSTGCNTCHDQLATTFHSGNRGGNIKACRICHVVSSGGSNLELQSRSIDSYVHAVHSFQAFNPGDINFADPVESLEYEHHINSEFPRFGILNCESCHNSGMYNVPNQARSMPGILSGTDAVAGRNIGTIPATVTGPAVRACGACHRAQKINADDASELAVLNQHFKTFGYVIENEAGLWESVVAKIMGLFK